MDFISYFLRKIVSLRFRRLWLLWSWNAWLMYLWRLQDKKRGKLITFPDAMEREPNHLDWLSLAILFFSLLFALFKALFWFSNWTASIWSSAYLSTKILFWQTIFSSDWAILCRHPVWIAFSVTLSGWNVFLDSFSNEIFLSFFTCTIQAVELLAKTRKLFSDPFLY